MAQLHLEVCVYSVHCMDVFDLVHYVICSAAPTDYTGTIEDLTFDGSTNRNCVTVTITDDDILEDTENFIGTLTTTDSSVTLTPDRAQVNIFEDSIDGENKVKFMCVLCFHKPFFGWFMHS